MPLDKMLQHSQKDEEEEWQTEDKMDAERGTRLMQDRTYTGKDESRTKLSKQITQMQNSTYSYEGQDGCRTGWMQEWTDAVQDRCRTGRIQDWTDAGQDRSRTCRTRRILYGRD